MSLFKDIFNENIKLFEKVCSLEGKNICLQNIKMELLAQLVDTRTHKDALEKEVSHLHTEYNKSKQEKGKYRRQNEKVGGILLIY